MIKRFTIILITTLALTVNSYAGSDGELLLKKNDPSNVKDCFERLNRATFAFNQGLDGIVFEPVAKAYRILPSPVRTGISNSLNNLSNLVTVPNNILQGDFKEAGVNSGRFVLNTTVGLLGIFDVAEQMGFSEYEKEDYGQSLGTAGVGPGCYLVLPVLGPSTIRDTAGSVFNLMGGDPWYNVSVKNDTQYFNEKDYYVSRGTAGVDFRAKNIESFDNLEENAMDFYASVKSLYLQDRKQKILNSKGVIDTMDDSDWEEIEDN
jgi:phospholipid-binding lipoprotein MlaA